MPFRRPALLLVCLLAAACQPAGEGPEGGDETALDTLTARGSYTQGYQIGQQGQGLPLDVEAFVAGIRDGLAGEGQLSDEEMMAAITEFRTLVEEASSAGGAANRAAGEEFLAGNRANAGVTETASGLQYEVLRDGDGPRPAATDTVTVHYRGTTLDGEVFDESYARGAPATFGLNQVISGWTEGVALMPVGSHYRFWIPADLAYGDSPPPGASFGPGATLVFEVELLEIQ